MYPLLSPVRAEAAVHVFIKPEIGENLSVVRHYVSMDFVQVAKIWEDYIRNLSLTALKDTFTLNVSGRVLVSNHTPRCYECKLP